MFNLENILLPSHIPLHPLKLPISMTLIHPVPMIQLELLTQELSSLAVLVVQEDLLHIQLQTLGLMETHCFNSKMSLM